jgi:hypothetical protein
VSTVLASGISTSGALTLVGSFAVVVVALVGISILAMAFGSKGGQMRKVAEKVFIVVVGASILAGAAVWASLNIFGSVIH